eukprot:6054246-Amphidinium_carterae.1
MGLCVTHFPTLEVLSLRAGLFEVRRRGCAFAAQKDIFTHYSSSFGSVSCFCGSARLVPRWSMSSCPQTPKNSK